MHALLDYNGHLPAYVNITDGKTADNKGANDIPLLKQSVVVADRFYNDFSLPNVWDSNEVFFVVRLKDNIKFISIKENDLPNNRHQHILQNEIIELASSQSKMTTLNIYEEFFSIIQKLLLTSCNLIGMKFKNILLIHIMFDVL